MQRNSQGNSQYTNVPNGKIAVYTSNGVIFKNAPVTGQPSLIVRILRAIFG